MTWTDEMKAELLRLSETKKDAELAKIFGVSLRSIGSIRHKIGAAKNAKPVQVKKHQPKEPNATHFDWADYNNEIL